MQDPSKHIRLTPRIMFFCELICRNCQWRTVCGRVDAIGRLRLAGLLRRDPDPDEGLLRVLFVETASRMTCPICKEKRLHAVDRDEAASSEEDWQAGDWQTAVLCELCREPIPAERVEALPGVRRCVVCQGKAEAGATTTEPEYCPRCGSLVEIRASCGSGITRYRRFCTGIPPCRL